MNKEEILKSLMSMKDQIGETDMAESELTDLINNKQVLESELEKLKKKASLSSTKEITESNLKLLKYGKEYIDVQLARKEQDRAVFNSQLLDNVSVIEDAQFLIDSGKEEIEVYKQRVLEYEATGDKAMAKKYNSEITANQNAISYLVGRVEELEKSKKENQEAIKVLESEVVNLQKYKDIKTTEIEDLEDRRSEIEIGNENSKAKTEGRIEQLKGMIDLINSTIQTPYNFSENLDNIISGVENDTLSGEELANSLEDFQTHMSNNFLVKESRQMALEDTQALIKSYQLEASLIETKLEDKEANYKFPFFAKKSYEKERAEVEASLATSKEKLASLKNDLSQKNEEIKNDKEVSIDLLMAFQIAPEDEEIKDKYLKDASESKAKEANHTIEAIELKRQISIVNKEIKDKEFILKKDKYKESGINTYAIKADEHKLEDYERLIGNLQNREELLANDIDDQIGTLISGLKNEIVLNNENLGGVVEKKIEEIQTPIVEPVIAPIVEPTIEEPIEEKKRKPIAFTPIKTFNDALGKVVEKAKACWKDHKKAIIATATAMVIIIVGSGLLKGCSTDKDTAEVTPTPTETVTPEEPVETPVETAPTNNPSYHPSNPVAPTPAAPVETPEVVAPTPTHTPTPTPTPTPTDPVGPGPVITPSDPVAPIIDVPAQQTLTVQDGQTMYHMVTDSNGVVSVEVISNDPNKTAEQSADAIENNTGLNANGNLGTQTGTTDVTTNTDGSIEVGITNSSNGGKTLTQILQEANGVTPEALKEQQGDMNQVVAEEGGISR